MSSPESDDTIAAIATAPGGAMRAILRISGADTALCLQRCFARTSGPPVRRMQRATVVTGLLNLTDPPAQLPCDVYLWPTDRSYTREPMAEVHTIGCPPLVQAALRRICAAGARLAGPGEFTLRALLAGRLDLPRAEAVLGVVDATSQRELSVALTQLAGGLSEPLNQLRDELLSLLADLEAGLDFVDEDIQLISVQQLTRQLERADREIGRMVSRIASRSVTRDAARVVLLGYPNVGKSSLLNALVADSAAITADRPGTTRDYVIRRQSWLGMTCELIDTAGIGLSVAGDRLDAAAQEMTEQQVEQAHLQLLCLDATRPLNGWEQQQLTAHADRPQLLVLTKTDLPRRTDLARLAIETSSLTGRGLGQLRRRIVEQLGERSSAGGTVVPETAARCGDSLRLAQQCVGRARRLAASRAGDELVAAEVRMGLDELGKVVGAVYTEDILDRIFSRFCIGK